MWNLLDYVFTWENAFVFGAWTIVFAFIWYIAVWGYIKISESWAQRNMIHPDAEGRYPLILTRNKRGVVAFDQSRGWGITIFNDDGSVQTIAAPNEVLDIHGDVEVARANSRAVVSQVPHSYSPQTQNNPSYTYAPSTSRDSTVIDNEPAPEVETFLEPVEKPELPKAVNFFDVVENRLPGHIIFGVDEDNTLVQEPIFAIFHQLVAGMSGYGKSVYLRNLVLQLLIEAETSNIRLGLADIENNTFPEFRNKRGVEWYAGSYTEIEQMVRSVLQELEHRKQLYEAFEGATPKDIERYNVLARRSGETPELPLIILIFDEFTALVNKASAVQKRIVSNIYQLTLRARKYGIFLVLAGQSFKSDIIDTTVIGQFGVNISFRVRSPHQSMAAIGATGAEAIHQPGEAFLKRRDGTILRVQTPLLNDDELEDALNGIPDGDYDPVVPDLVRDIIAYVTENHEGKVLFREVEAHFKKQGHSRTQVYSALRWMDDNNYVKRNAHNGRELTDEAKDKK